MSLQQCREVLRSELLHAGFEGRAIAESPLEDVDFGVSTPCFQAFFKLMDRIDLLENAWRSIQETIARYKSENRQAPRDLYLTFLLLDPVPTAQLPLLQSIANDPMVCRKIVLATDPDHISNAIGSLPFVAMGVGVTRPAPGLQDIFAAFAAHDYPREVLNVLSDRASAERILARLLDMPVPSEIPHIYLAALSAAGPQGLTSAPCRLESLQVSNFRGIRRAEIDLSGAITVIYGRNGTGKTSLYDALEWALVGNIERLEAENGDDMSALSPYLNLFSREPASVIADVSIDNVRTRIRRVCETSGLSNLSINDREGLDDRDALALIVGQQSAKMDTRILRRLVRTTYFLSQSTLKRFLSDDPK